MRQAVIVVAPLPAALPRGRERVELQRAHARLAVHASARAIDATLGQLAKTDEDVPLSSNGWFWSLSHSPAHVAGVVHSAPVGVDVEEAREPSAELVERILSPAERALFAARGEDGFLRTWTGKEALLKEFGVGLQALSRCRIVRVGDDELELRFDEHVRIVHQLRLEGHVVAVCAEGLARPRFLVHARPLGPHVELAS